jgi:DNA-binding NarL/FixJ family response regulator
MRDLEGCSNAEIAAHLHVAEKSLRNQISAVFDQMAVTSRSQAIVRARGSGFGRRGSEPT